MPLRPLLCQWNQIHGYSCNWSANLPLYYQLSHCWATWTTGMPLKNCPHPWDPVSIVQLHLMVGRSFPSTEGNDRGASPEMNSSFHTYVNWVPLCHWRTTETNSLPLKLNSLSIMPIDCHFVYIFSFYPLKCYCNYWGAIQSRSNSINIELTQSI